MPIEVCTIGGYEAIGKNMTAIKIDDRVIILDMGIHLENYIKFTEDEDIIKISSKQLTEVNAIPDISYIEDWRKKVVAIIPTHAHLDHIGAIPFLAKKFNSPIYGTPFTIEVIKAILADMRISIKNPLKVINTNSKLTLPGDISIEFLNMTHSTPQTVMIAIHTKYGTIVYANDFKFDNTPVLGKKPDFKRIKELGEKGVILLIVDSIYAREPRKTPSESVAREMLRDVMLCTDTGGKAVFVTTFSSHIARLKSIVEFGRLMKRKVVLMGRSLGKYVTSAQNVGISDFTKDLEIVKYSRQIRSWFRKLNDKDRSKYLFVITGHQGEPKSMLSKLADDIFSFRFRKGDHVIFSSTIIPTETNRINHAELEKKLKEHGVRVFRDIHVSGHASKEDLRDVLSFLKPKFLIPAHGNISMANAMKDLAFEEGYDEKHVFVVKEGDRIKITGK